MKKARFYTILVVLAVFVIGVAWLVRPSQFQQKSSQTYESYQTSDRLVQLPPKVKPANKTTEKYTQREIEEWAAARSDLAAQWNMADTAFIGLCIGGLGLFFIAWTLVETRSASKSASDTLKQATIATNAAVSSLQNDRAWIFVNDTPHSIVDKFTATYPDGRKEIHENAFIFQIRVKNIGKTPARNVRCQLDSRIVPVGNDVHVFSEAIDSMSDGVFLGPDTIYTKGRINIYGIHADRLRVKTHVAYIILKCEYQTIFDEQIRYTTVVYKFHPEGSHMVEGQNRTKFFISQVGKQRKNT